MERARRILEKARSTLANERIWMKSALVERERGQTQEVFFLASLRIFRHMQQKASAACTSLDEIALREPFCASLSALHRPLSIRMGTALLFECIQGYSAHM